MNSANQFIDFDSQEQALSPSKSRGCTNGFQSKSDFLAIPTNMSVNNEQDESVISKIESPVFGNLNTALGNKLIKPLDQMKLQSKTRTFHKQGVVPSKSSSDLKPPPDETNHLKTPTTDNKCKLLIKSSSSSETSSLKYRCVINDFDLAGETPKKDEAVVKIMPEGSPERIIPALLSPDTQLFSTNGSILQAAFNNSPSARYEGSPGMSYYSGQHSIDTIIDYEKELKKIGFAQLYKEERRRSKFQMPPLAVSDEQVIIEEENPKSPSPPPLESSADAVSHSFNFHNKFIKTSTPTSHISRGLKLIPHKVPSSEDVDPLTDSLPHQHISLTIN